MYTSLVNKKGESAAAVVIDNNKTRSTFAETAAGKSCLCLAAMRRRHHYCKGREWCEAKIENRTQKKQEEII